MHERTQLLPAKSVRSGKPLRLGLAIARALKSYRDNNHRELLLLYVCYAVVLTAPVGKYNKNSRARLCVFLLLVTYMRSFANVCKCMQIYVTHILESPLASLLVHTHTRKMVERLTHFIVFNMSVAAEQKSLLSKFIPRICAVVYVCCCVWSGNKCSTANFCCSHPACRVLKFYTTLLVCSKTASKHVTIFKRVIKLLVYSLMGSPVCTVSMRAYCTETANFAMNFVNNVCCRDALVTPYEGALADWKTNFRSCTPTTAGSKLASKCSTIQLRRRRRFL